MKVALQLKYPRKQVTAEETSKVVHDKSSTHINQMWWPSHSVRFSMKVFDNWERRHTVILHVQKEVGVYTDLMLT